MEYICVTQAMAAPVAAVWAKVAAFGDITSWITDVETCSLEGEGSNVVRVMTAFGMVMRERLVTLDAAGYRLVYAVEGPSTLPASGVQGEISMQSIGSNQTEVTWRARAETLDVPVSEIAALVGPFYSGYLENLKHIVETERQ